MYPKLALASSVVSMLHRNFNRICANCHRISNPNSNQMLQHTAYNRCQEQSLPGNFRARCSIVSLHISMRFQQKPLFKAARHTLIQLPKRSRCKQNNLPSETTLAFQRAQISKLRPTLPAPYRAWAFVHRVKITMLVDITYPV